MKLENFSKSALTQKETSNVKGGIFCEWYVMHTGNTHNAMQLGGADARTGNMGGIMNQNP